MTNLVVVIGLTWLCAAAWSAWDHRLRQKREREHHEYLMAMQSYIRQTQDIAAVLNLRMIRAQAEAARGVVEAAKDEDEPWKD